MQAGAPRATLAFWLHRGLELGLLAAQGPSAQGPGGAAAGTAPSTPIGVLSTLAVRPAWGPAGST